MVGVRKRGEEIRRFVLENVTEHPRDIVARTMARFDITREAALQHVRKLIAQKAIIAEGKTRNRTYRLHPSTPWARTYALDGLEEDLVYDGGIGKQLADLPDNVRNAWAHGITEMVNNAIDHSEGTTVHVELKRTAADCTVTIRDNGIGIFQKIAAAQDLASPAQAVLELSKGRFTTDPENHSGEGVFFCSRIFDFYAVASGDTVYARRFGRPADVVLPDGSGLGEVEGTEVIMKLSNNTSRTVRQVMDEFTTPDEDHYGFTDTVIPIKLAKQGDFLVSRSQAKRVLLRAESFRTVVFDFEGVDSIGQAFADEVFRVFHRRHPEVNLKVINANKSVQRMISRAEVTNPSN